MTLIYFPQCYLIKYHLTHNRHWIHKVKQHMMRPSWFYLILYKLCIRLRSIYFYNGVWVFSINSQWPGISAHHHYVSNSLVTQQPKVSVLTTDDFKAYPAKPNMFYLQCGAKFFRMLILFPRTRTSKMLKLVETDNLTISYVSLWRLSYCIFQCKVQVQGKKIILFLFFKGLCKLERGKVFSKIRSVWISNEQETACFSMFKKAFKILASETWRLLSENDQFLWSLLKPYRRVVTSSILCWV